MKVHILKYNTQNERYTSDTMLELSAIPRVGDKIVYNDVVIRFQISIFAV